MTARSTPATLVEGLEQLHAWFIKNKGAAPEVMRITREQHKALDNLTGANKPLPTGIRFNGREKKLNAYTYKDVPLKVV